MAPELRPTGIELLGGVPWGTHFCQFYQTKQDLLDVLVPYFGAGLEANEFCMWITSEPLQTVEARAALASAVPGVDDYIGRGQLEILDYSEWYTLGGAFDADRVLQGWVTKLHGAMQRGHLGLRLTGNTFWLERADWDAFADYEAKVNSVIGLYPMIALCTYCLDRCDAGAVIDVVKNHEFAMIKRDRRWDLIESSVYKRTKEELSDRTAALEAANQELEAFSYSVSHDLRAPLRAIDGFSQILATEYTERLDEDARRYLATIHTNAMRMGTLIDDMLAFSRMGRREMGRQSIDMAAEAQAAFDEVSGAAPARTVRLRIGNLPPAEGDRAMLRQVLVNLFSNAIKFTAPKTDAAIEIDGARNDTENVYRVRDNGVGFDMQYIDKLFGVFQRLHATEGFEGTGIGLAIVKRVIARHGGRVWAEGKIGEGATFSFSLPRS